MQNALNVLFRDICFCPTFATVNISNQHRLLPDAVLSREECRQQRETERAKNMSNKTKLHFETLQLHVGQEQADPATDSRAVPIYQTTSYVFHSAQHASDRFFLKEPGNIYGRLTNTTQGVFEDRVAALEGGVGGLAVASGAAAVTYAITNLANAGDHVVATNTIYGGTYNLLKHTLSKFGYSS